MSLQSVLLHKEAIIILLAIAEQLDALLFIHGSLESGIRSPDVLAPSMKSTEAVNINDPLSVIRWLHKHHSAGTFDLS